MTRARLFLFLLAAFPCGAKRRVFLYLSLEHPFR
jgi:hypothetical protein